MLEETVREISLTPEQRRQLGKVYRLILLSRATEPINKDQKTSAATSNQRDTYSRQTDPAIKSDG